LTETPRYAYSFYHDIMKELAMKNLICILLVAFIASWTTCTSDGKNDNLNIIQTIGPGGGIIQPDNGAWSFLVPSGALLVDTEITITSRPWKPSARRSK
jgi:hypothetical protein